MTDAIPAQANGAQIQPGDGVLIPVPSGQPVSLQEVVWNVPGPDGMTLRFRFIAPEIARNGGSVDYDTASADMVYLCTHYALPKLAQYGPQPTQIVISLSDRDVPFGETTPEATQYFDAYSYQDGACIWEMF
jgi:hypothetical protein